MSKLHAFIFVTLNGYYKGPDDDISWHMHGAEENEYAAESLGSGNILLFGRVTYEMMAGYWPTAMAMQHDPTVAKGMNSADKIVFSKTLKKVEWANTTLVKGDMIEEVIKLKQKSGKDMTLLGSGNVLTQLAEHSLIDEYAIMVDPIILSKGTTIFKNLKNKLNIKLTGAKSFKSGVVLLRYTSGK